MEMVIEECKKSLNSVPQRNYQFNERNFAYELYHQMRCNVKTKLDISGEIEKYRLLTVKDERINDDKVWNKFNLNRRNSHRRTPDLIIHTHETPDDNLAVFEIKKGCNSNGIIQDLSKLIVYTEGRLNYQYGIMVVFNCKLDDLNKFVKASPESDLKYFINTYKKIQVWCKDSEKSNLEILDYSNICN
jgi:hypothetical protein